MGRFQTFKGLAPCAARRACGVVHDEGRGFARTGASRRRNVCGPRRRAGVAALRLAVLLVMLAVAADAAAPGASASEAGASTTERKVQLFNIPAQPLAAALQTYSVVTGNEVICDSRLAAGRRSAPVVGLFTPEAALRMLIAGADLAIRYTGPQDVTLLAASTANATAGGGDDVADLGGGRVGVMVLDTLHVDLPAGAERKPDFSAYGHQVLREVKHALARDEEIGARTFDLQIDIWIDADGRVRQAQLLRSTGRPRLDAAIRRALEGTTIKQPPPADMPQPIRIAVVAL